MYVAHMDTYLEQEVPCYKHKISSQTADSGSKRCMASVYDHLFGASKRVIVVVPLVFDFHTRAKAPL